MEYTKKKKKNRSVGMLDELESTIYNSNSIKKNLYSLSELLNVLNIYNHLIRPLLFYNQNDLHLEKEKFQQQLF